MHPTSVFRTALNYGAINGLATFAFFLLLHYSGHFPLGPLSLTGIWIPIIAMVLSTKEVRNLNNGSISYWTAWRTGFLTVACGAFLFALLVYIFGMTIEVSFLDQYKSINAGIIEQGKEMGGGELLGEAMYEKALNDLDKMTLETLSFQEFFGKSFGGMFLAFITAAFLKRKQPDANF
jgi:hypothetical protein